MQPGNSARDPTIYEQAVRKAIAHDSKQGDPVHAATILFRSGRTRAAWGSPETSRIGDRQFLQVPYARVTIPLAQHSSEPFVVNLVMLDGDPAGVKVIEKSNWSGIGLEIPRPLISSAVKRAELSGPGVYILVGPPEETELPSVYVGEGNVVRARIAEHEKNKLFWTHAIVFASNANRLNKAHVQFLESSLVALASDAKRCTLLNGNVPQVPPLSEADIAEVNGFLRNILQLLGVLGHRYFERPSEPEITQIAYLLTRKGLEARGYESASGFVVREGSGAVSEETNSIPSHVRDLRAALVTKLVLVPDDTRLRFAQDYEFSSPSQAADVIVGGSVNGRTDWKTSDGRSLAEVQELASE